MTRKYSKAFEAIAQTYEQLTKDPVSDDGVTLAFLRLNINAEKQEGCVNFMWLPYMFLGNKEILPNELRAEIVKTLRFHADMLEKHDIDTRMKEIQSILESEADDEDRRVN
jgi:hypothetical protein